MKTSKKQAKNLTVTEEVAKVLGEVGITADQDARGVRLASGDVLVFGQDAALSANTVSGILRNGKPIKWAGIEAEDGRVVSLTNLVRKGNGLSGWQSGKLAVRVEQLVGLIRKSGLSLTVASIRETRFEDGGTSRVPVFEAVTL